MKNINGHVIIKKDGKQIFEGDNLVFKQGRVYLANCIKNHEAPSIDKIFFSNLIDQPLYADSSLSSDESKFFLLIGNQSDKSIPYLSLSDEKIKSEVKEINSGVAIEYKVDLTRDDLLLLENYIQVLSSIGLIYTTTENNNAVDHFFSKIVFDPIFITAELSSLQIIYYLYI